MLWYRRLSPLLVSLILTSILALWRGDHKDHLCIFSVLSIYWNRREAIVTGQWNFWRRSSNGGNLLRMWNLCRGGLRAKDMVRSPEVMENMEAMVVSGWGWVDRWYLSNQIEFFCWDTVQKASWMCDICQIKSTNFIGTFYKRPDLRLIYLAQMNHLLPRYHTKGQNYGLYLSRK